MFLNIHLFLQISYDATDRKFIFILVSISIFLIKILLYLVKYNATNRWSRIIFIYIHFY